MLNPKLTFKAAQEALGCDSSGKRSNNARQAGANEKPDPNARRHAEAATLAQAMYEACDESLGHDYLTRKGVCPCPGIRALSGEAVKLFGEAKWESRL